MALKYLFYVHSRDECQLNAISINFVHGIPLVLCAVHTLSVPQMVHWIDTVPCIGLSLILALCLSAPQPYVRTKFPL